MRDMLFFFAGNATQCVISLIGVSESFQEKNLLFASCVYMRNGDEPQVF
jgi:hypothetical protein